MFYQPRMQINLLFLLATGVNVLLIALWIGVSKPVRELLTPMATGSTHPTLLFAALAALVSVLSAFLAGPLAWRVARVILSGVLFMMTWCSQFTLSSQGGGQTVVFTPWPSFFLFCFVMYGSWRSLSDGRSLELLSREKTLSRAAGLLSESGWTRRLHPFWSGFAFHLQRPDSESVVVHVVPGVEQGRPVMARWKEDDRFRMLGLHSGALHVLWVVLSRPRQPYELSWWAEGEGVTVIGDEHALFGFLNSSAARLGGRHAAVSSQSAHTRSSAGMASSVPRVPLTAAQIKDIRQKGERVIRETTSQLASLPIADFSSVSPAGIRGVVAGMDVDIQVWPHPELPSASHVDAVLMTQIARVLSASQGQAVLWLPLAVERGELPYHLHGVDLCWGGLGSLESLLFPPTPAPSPVSERSAYDVLGVSVSASQNEIRVAYRRLIKRVHPDKVASHTPQDRQRAEEQAKEINAAYEKLTR